MCDAEYDFRDARVAIVAVPAPSPEVFSQLDLGVDRTDLLGTAIRVGTGIAREATIEDFRERVYAAAENVNVPGRMADRTLEGSSRYLRATPVVPSRDNDFEFELRIETYGFAGDDWNARAYLALEGDLLPLPLVAGGDRGRARDAGRRGGRCARAPARTGPGRGARAVVVGRTRVRGRATLAPSAPGLQFARTPIVGG